VGKRKKVVCPGEGKLFGSATGITVKGLCVESGKKADPRRMAYERGKEKQS